MTSSHRFGASRTLGNICCPQERRCSEGQVTIYLDDETERRMRGAARSSGLSQSKWIARLIQHRTRETWPEAVARLAGAWKDCPWAKRSARACRTTPAGSLCDVHRGAEVQPHVARLQLQAKVTLRSFADQGARSDAARLRRFLGAT